MKIELSHIFSVTIGFAIGFILKIFLDFNLASVIIKYFHWFPVRFIFRTNPPDISGDWGQIWDFSETQNFAKETDRYSNLTLKQLNKYCYAEFYSKGEKYCVYGKINCQYIVGEWYHKKDKLGYFGTFELKIIDSENLEGKWIGHSKSSNSIYGDRWSWKKMK